MARLGLVREGLQCPLVVLLAVIGPDEAVDQVLAQYLVECGLGVATSLGASASASSLASPSSWSSSATTAMPLTLMTCVS